MTRRRGDARALIAVLGAVGLGGCVAIATPAGGQSAESLSACDPGAPAALRLVVPESLPTGFRGGIHVDRVPPGYPYGATWADFGPLVVAAADGGQLRHAFVDSSWKRRDERFLRWPLEFEPGDGPARVSLQYTESHPGENGEGGYACRRELAAVVRHEPMKDPRLRLGKRRVSGRYGKSKYGALGVHWTVRVRGTLRRSAKRPVMLELYVGPKIHRYALEVRKRVKPRDGRFSAVLRVFTSGVSGPGGLRVRALYPGDVSERWPCADFVSSDETCGSVRDPRETD